MPISLRLSPETEARLSNLAAKTGRSKTFYATQAVEACLQDLEDAYLADKVRARVRSGAEKFTPLDVLERELGLDD